MKYGSVRRSKVKVKVNLPLWLTKPYTMKTYWGCRYSAKLSKPGKSIEINPSPKASLNNFLNVVLHRKE
jgi:hypothetical protein